jgi:hypothetical protein
VPFFKSHSLVLEQFRQVAVTGRPLYSLEPFRNYIENTTYQVDRLLLPLSSDGERVDMLMVGFHFKTGPYAA